jgi:hypothetical protein
VAEDEGDLVEHMSPFCWLVPKRPLQADILISGGKPIKLAINCLLGCLPIKGNRWKASTYGGVIQEKFGKFRKAFVSGVGFRKGVGESPKINGQTRWKLSEVAGFRVGSRAEVTCALWLIRVCVLEAMGKSDFVKGWCVKLDQCFLKVVEIVYGKQKF